MNINNSIRFKCIASVRASDVGIRPDIDERDLPYCHRVNTCVCANKINTKVLR